MKIYVAHSYGRSRGLSEKECKANVDTSVEIGRQLIEMGHNPLVPNLWHYLHIAWDDSPDEGMWFNLVSAWIKDCDALLMATEPIGGVGREVAIAMSHGIPIYTKVEDIEDN